VTAVKICTDDDTVVSGGGEGEFAQIILWRISTEQKFLVVGGGDRTGSALKGHVGEITSIDVSRDGKYIASRLMDGNINVYRTG
jgi:WD40 repeat protein